MPSVPKLNETRPQDLPEIGRHALQAMRERDGLWAILSGQRSAQRRELRERLERISAIATRLEPSALSDDLFVTVEAVLAEVVETLEIYLAHHTSGHDTALCQLLGEHLQRLRDAHGWIAQGLSPDPSKRPSTKERRLAAEQRAATVVDGLLAETDPISAR